MALLELKGVSKVFETGRGTMVTALQDVSLAVRPREIVAIVGRSGCGKTTLLRLLAGLIPATRGELRFGGRPLCEADMGAAGPRRGMGMVFQESRLFPWYSVEENIALPLELQGIGRQERRARARELCRLLGLAGFESARPRELSGGMCQRAALARALSRGPDVLLLDEPFGALDAITRERMNLELQALALASGVTVVLVTHSIAEAVFLADRVVLLSPRPGRIRAEVEVPFPRPRERGIEDDSGYRGIIRTLRGRLELEQEQEQEQ